MAVMSLRHLLSIPTKVSMLAYNIVLKLKGYITLSHLKKREAWRLQRNI